MPNANYLYYRPQGVQDCAFSQLNPTPEESNSFSQGTQSVQLLPIGWPFFCTTNSSQEAGRENLPHFFLYTLYVYKKPVKSLFDFSWEHLGQIFYSLYISCSSYTIFYLLTLLANYAHYKLNLFKSLTSQVFLNYCDKCYI